MSKIQHFLLEEKNMKQLNVSKKVTSPLMVWVSVLLIAATLLFSFMPIMCFDTTTGNEVIDEFVKDISKNVDIEIPEKIEITVGKLISSVRVMAKVIKVASNAAKSATSGTASADDVTKAAEELDALLETKAGQDTILVAAAVVCTFTNAASSDSSSTTLAKVINLMLVFISMMAVIVLIFMIPIKVIIMLIKALIPALSNIHTPELAASKVGSKLPEMLAFPFVMMILQTFIPGMTYGWGLVAICVTVATSVLFCTVISRLHAYEPKKFMYLNVLQGTAIVSIIGFFVFFFNMLKTNVVNNFLTGKFFVYVADIAATKKLYSYAGKSFTPNNAYLIDLLLIVVFILVFLSAAAYITYAANKLSCTVDPKHKESKLADCKLVAAIVLLVTYVAPTFIASKMHFFLDVTSTEKVGDESFLILSATEESALKAALAGIIIMIVAEVALIVLKKVLCKDLTALEASAIVCGRDEDAVPAEAAPAVEAAPVIEEAPAVEEVSAE